jgi:ribosomal protein S19E (S16A)
MEPDEPKLSKSDETVLRALSSGEQNHLTLDWVAIQHLRQKGLVEVTPSGPKITDKGRQAIRSP